MGSVVKLQMSKKKTKPTLGWKTEDPPFARKKFSIRAQRN